MGFLLSLAAPLSLLQFPSHLGLHIAKRRSVARLRTSARGASAATIAAALAAGQPGEDLLEHAPLLLLAAFQAPHPVLNTRAALLLPAALPAALAAALLLAAALAAALLLPAAIALPAAALARVVTCHA